MHLKFEGNWVYIMLVPAMILATIIVFALTPDMVLKPVPEENPGEDTDSAYVQPIGSGHDVVRRMIASSVDRRVGARPQGGPGVVLGDESNQCLAGSLDNFALRGLESREMSAFRPVRSEALSRT